MSQLGEKKIASNDELSKRYQFHHKIKFQASGEQKHQIGSPSLVYLFLLLIGAQSLSNVESKGLVGKLPGNPASCPEEPCNSDPQHVLYALKWTSFGFFCTLLLPILLYFLSKLISKFKSFFRNSSGELKSKSDSSLSQNRPRTESIEGQKEFCIVGEKNRLETKEAHNSTEQRNNSNLEDLQCQNKSFPNDLDWGLQQKPLVGESENIDMESLNVVNLLSDGNQVQFVELMNYYQDARDLNELMRPKSTSKSPGSGKRKKSICADGARVFPGGKTFEQDFSPTNYSQEAFTIDRQHEFNQNNLNDVNNSQRNEGQKSMANFSLGPECGKQIGLLQQDNNNLSGLTPSPAHRHSVDASILEANGSSLMIQVADLKRNQISTNTIKTLGKAKQSKKGRNYGGAQAKPMGPVQFALDEQTQAKAPKSFASKANLRRPSLNVAALGGTYNRP